MVNPTLFLSKSSMTLILVGASLICVPLAFNGSSNEVIAQGSFVQPVQVWVDKQYSSYWTLGNYDVLIEDDYTGQQVYYSAFDNTNAPQVYTEANIMTFDGNTLTACVMTTSYPQLTACGSGYVNYYDAFTQILIDWSYAAP